jgi:3-phosphoshikimate 1-carboxyvinyltransferase
VSRQTKRSRFKIVAVKVLPAKHICGSVTLPGDKSISHRAVMLASIAEGRSHVRNFATSADCASTIGCFRQLGISIEQTGLELEILGTGKRGLRRTREQLDCGNSGTTMRLMAGILAGQSFDSILTGDESLCGRPMRRIIEPLSAMGAQIESIDGKAPLKIAGGQLRPIRYEMPVASAQVKSCTLLAALYADGRTTVIQSTPTRDHTERMLRGFGIDVLVEAGPAGASEISVAGNSELRGSDVQVPGDISSAAFFIVAAACLAGSELRLKNVGVNPTRSAIINAGRQFGLSIELEDRREATGEPVADLLIRGGFEKKGDIENRLSGGIIANLIDEIPILAVLGTQLEGGLEVRDASELRVKESDRIASIVNNLRQMGAEVEEFEDGFRVMRSNLKGARIESFGDHRIAMAFAVAALLADGETEIVGAECADVSFPGFFEVLAEVAHR